MRYLSIFTLLVASSSMASASFLSFTCTPGNQNHTTGSVLVGGGTTAVACAAFDAGVGRTILSVTYEIDYTWQDSVSNGVHQLTFTATSGLVGTTGSQNTTSGPSVGSAFVTGWGGAVGTQSVAGYNVTVVSSNTVPANVLPDNGSYTVTGTYTYEVNQTGVPEPSTLALVGGVLVLAGIRKFRS